MTAYNCIESCYDNQRCELFEKGKSYEIAPTHPLICFFDCDAGAAARKKKREEVAKRLGATAAKRVAAQQADLDKLEDPEPAAGVEGKPEGKGALDLT